VPPLSSSTPVRRSSPRLALPADDNSDTGVCISSSKPCYGTRRRLKGTIADGSVVSTDGDKDFPSVANSSVDQVEYRHRLRNNAIRNSRRSSRFLHSVTNSLSSRRSAVGDEKLSDSRPDIGEPAVDQPTPQRRKRGWPKGLPRKKQVIVLVSNAIQVMMH